MAVSVMRSIPAGDVIIMSKISRYNNEGYNDPTASEALERVLAETDAADKRTRRLIRRIKQLIIDENYELLNRIVVRDNDTGRVYK